MRFETFLDQALAELREAQLLREPDDGSARLSVEAAARALGMEALDASSNDYLGLAARCVSRETPGKAGAGASRLIHGTSSEHVALEAELATWVHAETSLLFASTYAANLGLISALAVRDSMVISDSANHASLIDGARLGKAEVKVVPHLDLESVRAALRERRGARACWVVTESYFSMDGDGPDLAALRALCDEADACLIVDEAHALGVFGPGGGGRCAEAGIRADIVVGALGKAVGSHGGFVAGSSALRTFLWNKARSFVFSTALSPRHAQLTLEQVAAARDANQLRERLAVNAGELRQRLRAAGLPVAPHSFGPIVSLILGANKQVLSVAARLRAVGILAQGIRPPTVPVGAARLRLTVKATFGDAELNRLAQAVEDACHAS
ncbi:MAG: aminotransferase class I/II-fold pyridoxal phosphate-dependent enzyme [Polyangiaceae bacterium]